MSRSVLDRWTKRSRLSVHALNGDSARRERGNEAPQAKVAAFIDILIPGRRETWKNLAKARREKTE